MKGDAAKWARVTAEQKGALDTESRSILDLLVQGKTQPEIAASLGLHRSAVWRRVKRLKALQSA
jgi:DNA-binding NarL/FixJ family response regulator